MEKESCENFNHRQTLQHAVVFSNQDLLEVFSYSLCWAPIPLSTAVELFRSSLSCLVGSRLTKDASRSPEKQEGWGGSVASLFPLHFPPSLPCSSSQSGCIVAIARSLDSGISAISTLSSLDGSCVWSCWNYIKQPRIKNAAEGFILPGSECWGGGGRVQEREKNRTKFPLAPFVIHPLRMFWGGEF